MVSWLGIMCVDLSLCAQEQPTSAGTATTMWLDCKGNGARQAMQVMQQPSLSWPSRGLCIQAVQPCEQQDVSNSIVGAHCAILVVASAWPSALPAVWAACTRTGLMSSGGQAPVHTVTSMPKTHMLLETTDFICSRVPVGMHSGRGAEWTHQDCQRPRVFEHERNTHGCTAAAHRGGEGRP